MAFQLFICFVNYYELHCIHSRRRHVAVLNRKVSRMRGEQWYFRNSSAHCWILHLILLLYYYCSCKRRVHHAQIDLVPVIIQQVPCVFLFTVTHGDNRLYLINKLLFCWLKSEVAIYTDIDTNVYTDILDNIGNSVSTQERFINLFKPHTSEQFSLISFLDEFTCWCLRRTISSINFFLKSFTSPRY